MILQQVLRKVAALIVMICIVLIWHFWPREIEAQIVSSVLWFHLSIALEAFGTFLVAAFAAGYIARRHVVIPSLVICALMLLVGLLTLPRLGSATFLDLILANVYGISGSIAGAALGSLLGTWFYLRRVRPAAQSIQ